MDTRPEFPGTLRKKSPADSLRNLLVELLAKSTILLLIKESTGRFLQSVSGNSGIVYREITQEIYMEITTGIC